MTWRNIRFQMSNRQKLYVQVQLGQQLLHHLVALVHLEVLLVQSVQIFFDMRVYMRRSFLRERASFEVLGTMYPLQQCVAHYNRVSSTCAEDLLQNNLLLTVGVVDELKADCVIWVSLSPSIRCYINKNLVML